MSVRVIRVTTEGEIVIDVRASELERTEALAVERIKVGRETTLEWLGTCADEGPDPPQQASVKPGRCIGCPKS